MSSDLRTEPTAAMRLALGVVWLAQFAVPGSRRRRWQREWEAELWFASRSGRPLLFRSLNAIPHALALGWQDWSFDMLLQDLRYAVRQLAKSPGFTAVAVITLALGIGANTLIFSIIDSTLINPLPFRDADRLVYLWRTHATMQLMTSPTMGQLTEWREQVDGFERIEALSSENLTLTGEGDPVRIVGTRVSPEFFSFLGVEPMLGRGFTTEEATEGNDRVVVLGAGIWRTRFAADPDIVSREIRMDDDLYTVVGVMPAGFRLQAPFSISQMWLPLVETGGAERGGVTGMARLRQGVAIEAVNEELAALASERELSDTASPMMQWKGTARKPTAMLGDRFERALWAFQGAVAFVLLIAAANVANLLLARGTARRRELAIRAAIGAARGRIVRQLMTESLLLAVGGGILGALLATWGLDLIRLLRPEDMNSLETLRMDPRMLLLTAALTLSTGFVFGLLPALQSAGRRLLEGLNDGTPGTGTHRDRLRQLLVVSEVALSTVLLVGAGLLISSFVAAQNTDPGFDPDGVLTVQIHLQDQRYAEPAQRLAFWDELAERLSATLGPGAGPIAFASGVPPRTGIMFGAVQVEGQEAQPASMGRDDLAAMVQATPGYFEALRIPVQAGRTFVADDRDSSDNPVIINAHFAETYWPGENAVGKRMRIGGEDAEWNTVIAIVDNVKSMGLTAQHGKSQLYYPHNGSFGDWIVVRSDGDPLRHVDAIRAAVWEIDPEVPLTEIALVTDLLGDSISGPRFNASLMAVFAVIALCLALIGIYGVLSCSVIQRTREIGIRMALGSSRGSVLSLIARNGIGLVALGLVIGVAGAAAVARLISSLLYGIEPTDPITYGAVVLLLLATSVAACILPARRATRVDPMIALRSD